MKAITIRQPWAWLVLHGKGIENRDWPTQYTGPLAIHAAQGMTGEEYVSAVEFVRRFDAKLAAEIPPFHVLPRGCIIGRVEMVGCVSQSTSPWFQGPYGHVYVDPHEFVMPVRIKGALSLWDWHPVGGFEQYETGKLRL